MIRKSAPPFIIFIAVLTIFSCAEKKPQGPPAELTSAISEAEALFAKVSGKYALTDQQAAPYRENIGRARQLMETGDYEKALAMAKTAQLEITLAWARRTNEELAGYNPPPTLTYYYRQNMLKSEEARKAGDLDGAIRFAAEAQDQASHAIEVQAGCIEVAREELRKIKGELEYMYRPAHEMELLYWEALDELPMKDCSRVQPKVDRLWAYINKAKAQTITQKREFTVTATPEFVRQYGDPIMYEKITPNGYLETRVNRVPVGFPVIFLNSMMFSRQKTFYYVEDPRAGVKGWMAERYLWPERAALRSSLAQ